MLPAAFVGRQRRASPIGLTSIYELHAQRTTAARQAIEVNAWRNQETSGRRWVDKQVDRLPTRSQQFANFWIFDPKKPLGFDELRASDNSACLLQDSRNWVRKRSNCFQS